MKSIIRWRSAVTGKFVSKAYALANPETTVREVRLVPDTITTDPGDE
jgi:hypothetical protein